MTKSSNTKPAPIPKKNNESLSVTKISRVAKILAVVNVSPSPVK